MAKLPNGHGGWVDAHHRQTDLDLQILDLLRGGPKSAYWLAQALTSAGEVLGTDAVRERLKALASRGLVAGTASAHEAEAPPPLADPWRITEEGRALVEPEAGVASAPYDREVGGEDEEGECRDAGFWVLLLIAVLTAVCATYSLLVATGVLGGTWGSAWGLGGRRTDQLPRILLLGTSVHKSGHASSDACSDHTGSRCSGLGLRGLLLHSVFPRACRIAL